MKAKQTRLRPIIAGCALAACLTAAGLSAQARTAGNRPPRTSGVSDFPPASISPSPPSLRLPLPRPLSDADYYDDGAPDPLKVELGKLLFFDKVLSGNQNISCATCHHALTDTGDGLSLSLGEKGIGLGVCRDPGPVEGGVLERVPRNAPHVFNLGVRHFEKMFWDGRVEVDPSQPSGFSTPAGDALPLGLDNVLAAQAMFPVTSPTEMAGQPGDNPVADAAAAGDLPEVWRLLAGYVAAYDGYFDLFSQVYPDVQQREDITYVHIANAIAAFEAFAWRSDESPFDRFLRGNDSTVMTAAARRGMELFYGTAGCASCHAGNLLTDLDFHAVAMPQIGPGKGNGLSRHEDYGRENVTGDEADRLRFRTPSLRNVALTGPWGHAGAYNDLRTAVQHMLDPEAGLIGYDTSQAVLPSRPDLDDIDFRVHNDPEAVGRILAANELEPVVLTPQEIDLLIEFLHALTDRRSIDLRRDVPKTVPSGLPLFD